MHYRFHVNVFARPAAAVASATLELRGKRVERICAADGRPLTFDAFLPVTFEEALESLVKLPRLDAEPDGFFVLAGGAGPTHWSTSGHLFDFDGRLHRVELHGTCPAEPFDGLLRCLGWPGTPLAFELVAEGVALSEAAFRRWAEC